MIVHTLAVSVLGWMLACVGALIALASEGKHQTDGPAVLVCGLVLVIARAVFVRFDRLHPPK